mgnify:CR=1 FL=1
MSFLFATISLVLGLYFLRGNLVFSIIVSLAYFAFLIYRFGKKKFILFVSMFAIGVLIPIIPFPSQSGTYSGFVVEARDNYIIYQAGFDKYYVSSEENDFELGDYLVCEGYTQDIRFNTYESRFDFKEYLANKGVEKELKTLSIDRKFHSFIRTHQFKKNFLSHFDKNAASLIDAFLFNEKDYSSSVISRANDLGVIYLISLSGIYLHLLFAILCYLLSLKFSKKTSQILPFLILLPFAFFSFTKIGTIRVYAMYLLKYLNEFHLKKKRSHIELVSVLALIFVIIDYHLVYQEAFYIGFLLSLLTPLMQNSIKFIDKKKRKIVYPLLLRSFMFPIQVNNGYLNLLSSIFYLIIFPFNFFFILISMISIVIPFYGFVNSVGSGLTWILEKMDLINIKIPFGNWGGYFGLIYYGVFFLGLFLMESVRLRDFKNSIVFLIIVFVGSIVPLQEPLTNYVSFINVGQGDAILIKNHTHTVMIDTGGQKSFDIATESLIPFLHKNKITHLDALITTHDDFDHSGAKDSLIANFKVYNYLSKPEQFPYKVGDIELQNLNVFGGDDDNDKSLVLSMNFMKKKWLFMGDASTNVEKEIISAYDSIDCDILKIGHHGSKTSTCNEFIKATSPKEAIISVGASNYYGHPNKEVLEILTKNNVKIRRTDEEGTISYFSLFA